MIVQSLLTIALVGSLLYIFGQKRLLGTIRLGLYAVICAGLFFVWSPDQSTAIANHLGVGRGVDLIYYIWIVLSLAVFVNIHLKLRENTSLVTQLARQIAIAEAQRNLSEQSVQAVHNQAQGTN
ncbi:DUF2304 domain-containing protein [Massilia litorea]|uniref:DUF2304 domain-containing protein n=1 Tax=Massilia litorea TaxID=2769491 RepID=A0A7L9U7C0_9BURK|nr:DUF2304 domain-containing protein [Massilia litorea]QOL50924.1 DUF2304 domain-containing protein [Massilia litorea]